MVTVSYGRLISISIHSPYTGRDVILLKTLRYAGISIHSPYTGRDRNRAGVYRCSKHFNPLSLYRERPFCFCIYQCSSHISIHSPYTGRDVLRLVFCSSRYISIHSPYTGRDALLARTLPGTRNTFQSTLPIQGETFYFIYSISYFAFQSTLPIQGETECRIDIRCVLRISIHSPYTGRDSNFAHKTPNIQPISYAKRQTKELFPTPTQQIITSLALISSISRCESPCIFMCTSHSH